MSLAPSSDGPTVLLVHLDEPPAAGANPPPPPLPAAPARQSDDIEPLTAELRRYHLTASKRFLAKLSAARDALSHSHPGADTEAVLEAALDLLLAKHDRTRGLVSRRSPRTGHDTSRPR